MSQAQLRLYPDRDSREPITDTNFWPSPTLCVAVKPTQWLLGCFSCTCSTCSIHTKYLTATRGFSFNNSFLSRAHSPVASSNWIPSASKFRDKENVINLDLAVIGCMKKRITCQLTWNLAAIVRTTHAVEICHLSPHLRTLSGHQCPCQWLWLSCHAGEDLAETVNT